MYKLNSLHIIDLFWEKKKTKKLIVIMLDEEMMLESENSAAAAAPPPRMKLESSASSGYSMPSYQVFFKPLSKNIFFEHLLFSNQQTTPFDMYIFFRENFMIIHFFYTNF